MTNAELMSSCNQLEGEILSLIERKCAADGATDLEWFAGELARLHPECSIDDARKVVNRIVKLRISEGIKKGGPFGDLTGHELRALGDSAGKTKDRALLDAVIAEFKYRGECAHRHADALERFSKLTPEQRQQVMIEREERSQS